MQASLPEAAFLPRRAAPGRRGVSAATRGIRSDRGWGEVRPTRKRGWERRTSVRSAPDLENLRRRRLREGAQGLHRSQERMQLVRDLVGGAVFPDFASQKGKLERPVVVLVEDDHLQKPKGTGNGLLRWKVPGSRERQTALTCYCPPRACAWVKRGLRGARGHKKEPEDPNQQSSREAEKAPELKPRTRKRTWG